MPFDAREATVASVHKALFTGEASCRDIVQAFLARIQALNPILNAIISLNPDVLEEADKLDGHLVKRQASGLLFGVPILLKDNFDAVNMPTTAGSMALSDLWPLKDAAVVTALRGEGAIILGKTNLHEFALEGLSVSSLGGQVVNPYDLNRTAGGSSGGSGAAIAASLAVMATGTDTVNSLRNPASANSLYSFRPTTGIVPSAGVVPVSSTQDAVGMIGRSLDDITLAFKVMSNLSTSHKNVGDTVTDASRNTFRVDQTALLASEKMKRPGSLRLGIMHGLLEYQPTPESQPVITAFSSVQTVLREMGIKLVDIFDTDIFNASKMLDEMDVQMFEIRGQMDTYLGSPHLQGSFPRSFSSIFTSQEPEFLVIPAQYRYVRTALTSSQLDPEYTVRKAKIDYLKKQLYQEFESKNLDAVIYPQQKNMVVTVGSSNQYGRNGIMAALTGCPVVCVPIGFGPRTESAPLGVPIGMEILGMPRTENHLFEIAQVIDAELNARKPPVTIGIPNEFPVKHKYKVPPVVSLGGLDSIDQRAYPLGQI